ncbi:MAG: SDR family NAD(P)-dependent oxidoreductase, partial [Clostridia bacterium]|nr:SDR family NAD(P)-dependent oxidoreductase [Clostridia bacterium]
MKVLITGASSGIGREMARILAPKCEQLVLVGRNAERLEQLRDELSANKNLLIDTVSADLSLVENCINLHKSFPDIDLL